MEQDSKFPMSPTAFRRWLKDMQRWGVIVDEIEVAPMLGRHPNSILNMKKRGADLTTALACQALIQGFGPYR